MPQRFRAALADFRRRYEGNALVIDKWFSLQAGSLHPRVLDHVKAITDWTAGGLQAPSDPGTNSITECTMLMEVKDDQFTRLYPEIGSADDSGNGFACDPSQVMALTGDYGDVNAGKDPNG